MTRLKTDRMWLEANPEISFFGNFATMPEYVFERLSLYQTSIPTAPSPGRIYKRHYKDDGWILFVVQPETMRLGKPGCDHLPYKIRINDLNRRGLGRRICGDQP